jgi:hypothetical protein
LPREGHERERDARKVIRQNEKLASFKFRQQAEASKREHKLRDPAQKQEEEDSDTMAVRNRPADDMVPFAKSQPKGEVPKVSSVKSINVEEKPVQDAEAVEDGRRKSGEDKMTLLSERSITCVDGYTSFNNLMDAAAPPAPSPAADVVPDIGETFIAHFMEHITCFQVVWYGKWYPMS